MDINEPSLMDVAHDTINSNQGPTLIEVAYSPSSEGKGPGSFSLANRIPAQRHRSLPFSLSLCNGWEGSRRSEAYRPADHQIQDWALLKNWMEWPTPPKSAYVIWELMAGNNPYGFDIW